MHLSNFLLYNKYLCYKSFSISVISIIFSIAVPVPETEYMLIDSLLMIPLVTGKVAVCKIRGKRQMSWIFLSTVQIHREEIGKQHSNLALASLRLLLLNCHCCS